MPQIFEITRTVQNTTVRYRLYVPSMTSQQSSSTNTSGRKVPLFLLLHGFGGKLEHMQNHANRLADLGIVVFTPDMSSLTSPSITVAQLRNIQQIIDHLTWLINNTNTNSDTTNNRTPYETELFSKIPPIDQQHIYLFGHSAGGAVVYETGIEIFEKKLTNVMPRAIILLDGVPWPRTIQRSQNFPFHQIKLISLRAEPSAWNMHNELGKIITIMKKLIDADQTTTTNTKDKQTLVDLLICKAGHGDPVDPKGSQCFMKALGLLGPAYCWDIYNSLILAIGEDAMQDIQTNNSDNNKQNTKLYRYIKELESQKSININVDI